MPQKSTDPNFTVRQHHTPQTYLKGFSLNQDEQIFVYDRKVEPEGLLRKTHVSDTGFVKHLYTYNTIEGNKENLEDIFSEHFEAPMSKVLPDIQIGRPLSIEQRSAIGKFIAAQYARTPYFKDRLEQIQRLGMEVEQRLTLATKPRQEVKDFLAAKNGVEPTDEEIDHIYDFILDPAKSNLEVEFSTGHWVKYMLLFILDSLPFYLEADWVLVYSDRPFAFLTCDNPLLLLPPKNQDPHSGYGIGTMGAKKIIPLRPNLCLSIYDRNPKPETLFRLADRDVVRDINKRLLLQSRRETYSPDKGKLEKLMPSLPTTKKKAPHSWQRL